MLRKSRAFTGQNSTLPKFDWISPNFTRFFGLRNDFYTKESSAIRPSCGDFNRCRKDPGVQNYGGELFREVPFVFFQGKTSLKRCITSGERYTNDIAFTKVRNTSASYRNVVQIPLLSVIPAILVTNVRGRERRCYHNFQRIKHDQTHRFQSILMFGQLLDDFWKFSNMMVNHEKVFLRFLLSRSVIWQMKSF